MADPFDDPEAQAWAKSVVEDLVPKISGSAITVSLVPKNSDVKFAVELGFSVMLDKPILAVVEPGAVVPEKLARVADKIIEGPVDDPTFQARFQAALTEMLG